MLLSWHEKLVEIVKRRGPKMGLRIGSEKEPAAESKGPVSLSGLKTGRRCYDRREGRVQDASQSSVSLNRAASRNVTCTDDSP